MSHDATPLLDLQVRTVVSLHAHASQPLELAFVVNRSAGEIGILSSSMSDANFATDIPGHDGLVVFTLPD
jgi:hypothetical protein